jgi:hypothetical protein
MRNGTDYNILVDIPEEAHRCSDNRVYVVVQKRYFKEHKYNKDEREWIGKAVNEHQMHPNNTFKLRYPELLKSVPHLNVPVYVKQVGMYAAALAIGERSGLYQDLISSLGPRMANLVMDYATYSIITKSNVLKDFETEMSNRMLFLGEPYSDSWINEQFNKTITDNQLQAFKYAWMKHFTTEELSNVWLCIDGSNDNCEVDIDEAEPGKAKSHKNIDVISFLYAVTEDGTPVTSQIYRGSRVDSQALKEMITILAGYSIKPKGFILDRGFCDENCIQYLMAEHYDYVIMMKENINGYKELRAKYQDKIRLKWKYALGHGYFGITDKVQLFKQSPLTSDVAFIWDGKNGTERIDYLIDGLMEFIETAEKEIQNGKEPKVPGKYKDLISINAKGESWEIVVHDGVIQNEIDGKGYHGLITSRAMSAKEANNIYDLRDCSEKQYSLMKTQLGDAVFRAHNMHRIAVREMVAFTASIIRHDLMLICRNAKPCIDTNLAIKELKLINMNLIGNNRYMIIHNQNKRQKFILQQLGVTEKSLDHIAKYETDRFNQKTVYPIQSISENSKENTSDDKKEKSDAEDKKGKERVDAVKRHPGRPKGSKNKTKIMKENRKPGRPKGSKNKLKK